ncbi:MAG: bifunctional chorismate mutase/prephenate dehydratase [Clostridiales bacterium]|nr:bifunctional chorismate mutase/prephenate dehydratase [Clostridiales bacterium]
MDLQEIRAQIDGIDDELVRLFERRMALAGDVASYKREQGLPVSDRTREREIVSRVTQGMDEQNAAYTKVLFSTLFDLSRSAQDRALQGPSALTDAIRAAAENTPREFPSGATVAVQGREGAYSSFACDRLFQRPSIMYFSTFESVFQAVEKGFCRYGILPIENSLYGSVTEVYDLMSKYNFHIARSVRIKIDHALLAKKGTALSDIREIVSHEQALGQCADFIKSLGDVRVTVCSNTAEAARAAAESGRNDIAALASPDCASLYGLSVLKTSVQNSDNNHTRFICISKDIEVYPGANRISLMLTLPHRPGSLYRMMARFAALGLNLTKLESRPIEGLDFEFMFYFDIEADVCAAPVLGLLGDLDRAPETFNFLGAYSEL